VRPLIGLTTVALLALASACGDDDDDAGDTASTAAGTPTSTAAAATETTHASTTSEAAGGDTTLPASDYPVTPVTTMTTATTGATGGTGAASGGTVSIADTSLGPILVDSNGMTLYMYAPDEAGPSTCVDRCLAAWPAVPGPVTGGQGVDASLLGTATRPDDGSAQATCNGWPLYTFVQDAAPGDVNGQGANDVWYVLDASCNPIDET